MVVQRGRHTAPGRTTETCRRSLWALPALRAWETPVPAPLGYTLKAHSDKRPGQAGRSPVSQAAAQPRDSQPTASHQLGAALLQTAVCAPCATVGVSCTGGHLVQSGTQPSCRPRREHHVLDPPLPTRNLLGAWEVAGPTPQLSACCSSSQLFPSLVSLVLALGLGPGPFPPTSSPRPSPPSSPFSTVPPAHAASISVSRVSVLFSPPPASDRLEDPSPLPD